MMWRNAEVLALRRSWGPAGRRCAELAVRVSAAPVGATRLVDGEELIAIAYEALTGVPRPGETVRLEVSALDRDLGTGGHAMVAARPDVLPDDPDRAGHLVKARYMPDQVMVAGVDEQGMPHHERLSGPAEDLVLDGTPVVVADLHSSLPAILAGVAALAGEGDESLRTVYVMTDGGALPLAYSRTVAALQRQGRLAATVTAGQAWGGDVEAVSVHNALLAARRVLGADLIVVVQGPGNLGTDTPWGFSGVACGDAVNAVAALGGRAVACLRISQADARKRHRGISHHSMTAYGRVALASADVVVPVLPGVLGERVDAQARRLCEPRATGGRHRRVDMKVDGLMEALEAFETATGVRMSTMGRGLREDAAAFLAAGAAGRHAARLALLRRAGRTDRAGSTLKPMKTFEDLFAELQDKAAARPAGSGTVEELDRGVHFIGKKLVEEAAESWMACEHESDEAACEEISQLLYHAQVMMIAKGYSLEDVYKYL